MSLFSGNSLLRARIQDLRILVKLGIPMIVSQLSGMLMGFTDTLLCGRYSALDLAATALATSFYLLVSIGAVGLLIALVPVVSSLNGAGRQKEIPGASWQGIYYSLIIAAAGLILLLLCQPLLGMMDITPELKAKSSAYLWAVTAGFPGYVLFVCLEAFSEGLKMTKPPMYISFAAVFLNAVLDYVLIFGAGPFPELGALGAGIATAAVSWSMAAGMAVYIRVSKALRPLSFFAERAPGISAASFRTMFHIGLPTSGAMVAELLIYSIAAIILAPLGEKVLSANQIVFNFISLVFMIPLGLAKALTVMVSFAIGERNLPEARRCTTSAQLLSFVLSAAVSAVIFAAPEAIAAIYTDDEAVITLLMPALLVAAVQPFPDFQQITAQGALRGYRETRSIFFVTLISYWIVGLPLGYALSMTDLIVPKMGMIGFWIGFLAGIFTASALYFLTLFLRVFRMKSVRI